MKVGIGFPLLANVKDSGAFLLVREWVDLPGLI